MFSRIILFALIAGVVYLNYTTPQEDDHKAQLIEALQLGYALPEEQQARIWKGVDYSNFFVCSFMKTTGSSVMISYGFMKQVTVANEKWLEETRTRLQQQTSYY